MLVFDQLKKDDPQLRFLAVLVLGGLLLLFGGLWWVQVVSVRYYREKLETQSTRTIRMPAARGKILDREGRPLAENHPSYNIDLYLEELSKNYQFAYTGALSRTRKYLSQQKAEKEKELNRKLTSQEARQFSVTEQIKTNLMAKARYEVTSNMVADLGARLQQPISLSEKTLQSHYEKALAIPLPILTGLHPMQVGRFEEQSFNTAGMYLEVQSLRYYPNGPIAAHLLGYLERNNKSIFGEIADYNNRLPDYLGVVGIEKVFDDQLHGAAGEKLVVINNAGYRQSETIATPAEPGGNVVLTIDLDIQKAAERALRNAAADVRGAVVVMDATNGDVLALASAPSYDPNFFVEQHDEASWTAEMRYLADTNSRPQINRAMYENYPPGSIFKIVVGLAAMEEGVLDPNAIYNSPGRYPLPGKRDPIGDTAGSGPFNFEKALAKSSNCYFINYGIKPGVLARVLALGQHLHLGERTGLLPHQETGGRFPKPKDTAKGWYLGDTAYLSIGQGKIAVTPLQMAVMTTAVANGGKVFWPRLVSEIQPYGADEPSQHFPAGQVRDMLPVSQHSLKVVHEGMKADVEGRYEGTGHRAAVPGLSIAGKTGTAEVEKHGHIQRDAQITWFVSFAPAEAPR
ncbi:MAG TPA: penicillin-binding transpeptidase domain-containing protein, partial [Verrucomicrobiae bacterium]|nr:penicillin-binding transpeptidase domain-containing protein [Verrucomicrobiae bacterium]